MFPAGGKLHSNAGYRSKFLAKSAPHFGARTCPPREAESLPKAGSRRSPTQFMYRPPKTTEAQKCLSAIADE